MLKKCKTKILYWLSLLFMKIFDTKDFQETNQKSLRVLKNIYEILERLLIFSVGLLFGIQDFRLLIVVFFLLMSACFVAWAIKIREGMSK